MPPRKCPPPHVVTEQTVSKKEGRKMRAPKSLSPNTALSSSQSPCSQSFPTLLLGKSWAYTLGCKSLTMSSKGRTRCTGTRREWPKAWPRRRRRRSQVQMSRKRFLTGWWCGRPWECAAPWSGLHHYPWGQTASSWEEKREREAKRAGWLAGSPKGQSCCLSRGPNVRLHTLRSGSQRIGSRAGFPFKPGKADFLPDEPWVDRVAKGLNASPLGQDRKRAALLGSSCKATSCDCGTVESCPRCQLILLYSVD